VLILLSPLFVVPPGDGNLLRARSALFTFLAPTFCRPVTSVSPLSQDRLRRVSPPLLFFGFFFLFGRA